MCQQGTLGVIAYYGALGIGYMMAEIFLIQRFVFFLADPVYANAIVITILLISSGLGSLASGTLKGNRRTVVMAAVGGIVAFVLFYRYGLSSILKRARSPSLKVFWRSHSPRSSCSLACRSRGLAVLSRTENQFSMGVGDEQARSTSPARSPHAHVGGFQRGPHGGVLVYVCAALLFGSNAKGRTHPRQ
jgi:hypothetical protein